MFEEEDESSARITKVLNETLQLQKALQEVDVKISQKNEKVSEYESISTYITINNPRLFEKVGRLFIEKTSENWREKHETEVIENRQLERSRELLILSFKRSESSLREESQCDPLYHLRRALVRHGDDTTARWQWLVYNVPTGSQ